LSYNLILYLARNINPLIQRVIRINEPAIESNDELGEIEVKIEA
jgi:hypothetical protein